MYKITVSFLILCCLNICYSQQYDFYPKNENGVSMSDFKTASTILEETISQVKERKGSYNYANLWNISVAYQLLGKDSSLIKGILEKSKKANPYNFSLTFVNTNNSHSKWIGTFTKEEYAKWYKEALLLTQNRDLIKENQELTDLKKEIDSKNYEKDLVKIISEVRDNDRRFRVSNNIDDIRQMELDKINIKIIDSLYSIHKEYIGKSLVGIKLSSTMWAVIQHSNLNKMEKYLPVIKEAIDKGELNKTVIKLLIDRIYSIKHNKQIFGSQVGIPIAEDTIVSKIRQKYGFDVTRNNKVEIKGWLHHKK